MTKLVSILEKLIEADDPAVRLEIAEQHADLLLTDEAILILSGVESQCGEMSDELKIVRTLRARLERARTGGLREAFLESAAWADPLGEKAAEAHFRLATTLLETYNDDSPDRVDAAIQHFEVALAIFRSSGRPDRVAETQTNLGNAYLQRSLPHSTQDLEVALSHYRRALEFFDPNRNPEEWAIVQDGIATVLQNWRDGNWSANIERAIELRLAALAVVKWEQFPSIWGTLEFNLGNAYLRRFQGGAAANIETAIEHYERALEVMTEKDAPEDWAAVQHARGEAWRTRILGSRTDNVERAIECYKRALRVRTQASWPTGWARTSYGLASALADRLTGSQSNNHEDAISHYQAALGLVTRQGSPDLWANIQNGLGAVFFVRIGGDRAENIENAIAHYLSALEVRTEDRFPKEWATTQNNLGSAWLARVRGERADNIERAIDCFNASLRVRAPEAQPDEWAHTQDALGRAWKERIRGNAADNIERAIEHYQLALTKRTRSLLPRDWATTRNNLANAYLFRIRGERSGNIEAAIEGYSAALDVFSPDDDALLWAMAHNGLGEAYRSRVEGRAEDNLESAIEHLQKALDKRSATDHPLRWAMSASNLGTAFLFRKRGDHRENLERAIELYTQTLSVHKRDALPEQWAITQSHLGNAWALYGRIGRVEDYDRAINHYKQCLEVYDRESFPADFGRAMNNLANTYSYRANASGSEEDILLAARFYRQALLVYVADEYPFEHRRTSRNRGDLFFENRLWKHALASYRECLRTGNLMIEQAYTPPGRRSEATEISRVFANSAFCLLKLGRIADALNMLEGGKARLLADAYVIDQRIRADGGGVILELREQLRAIEAEYYNRGISSTSTLFEQRDRLENLRAGLRSAMHSADAGVGSTSSATETLAAIPVGSAVIAPVVTPAGTAAFVIPQGSESLTSDRVLWLADYSVVGELRQPFAGGQTWEGAYSVWRLAQTASALNEWMLVITKMCELLWERLMKPLLKAVDESKAYELIVLSQGGLQNFPLHAASPPAGDGEPTHVDDRYVVRYAPSLKTFQQSLARASNSSGAGALVIGSGSDGPGLAKTEARIIAARFGAEPLPPRFDRELLNSRPNVSHLHFSCHASFAWGQDAFSSYLELGEQRVEAWEIMTKFDLSSVRLVVLPACETGIIEDGYASDEVFGLASSFLHAGAAAVISSLWTVGDVATFFLINRFYELYLDDRKPAAQALFEAQRWLRRATRREIVHAGRCVAYRDEALDRSLAELILKGPASDRPFSHPFYWAAFAYTGA